MYHHHVDGFKFSYTLVGEDYRKIRKEKPMRRQPRTLTDMPFLYSDKLGQPNYGPYYVRINISITWVPTP